MANSTLQKAFLVASAFILLEKLTPLYAQMEKGSDSNSRDLGHQRRSLLQVEMGKDCVRRPGEGGYYESFLLYATSQQICKNIVLKSSEMSLQAVSL
jgi:hypothetical protein